MNKWTNLSYANVATTSPKAHLIASEWAKSLARGGAAEFDADAEKEGMMPLRKATATLLGCTISDVCVGSSATELLGSLAWAIAPKKGNIVSTRASLRVPLPRKSEKGIINEEEISISSDSIDCYSFTKDEDIKFKIISRSNVNSKMSGPLIIIESTAITYVDVNYDVTRDTDSNLLIVNSEMK